MKDILKAEDFSKVDVSALSPLVLAFIGDAVFALLVKSRLLCLGNQKVSNLHKKAANLVSCTHQAKAFLNIEKILTEEEYIIYKRGRNAKQTTIPKNSDVESYHVATGLECLLGYLYLKNKQSRMLELFEKLF